MLLFAEMWLCLNSGTNDMGPVKVNLIFLFPNMT